MDWWITFLSGTGAGGVVVYLIMRLFEHRLAKDLSASDRKANAAIEFRNKINEAMATLPPANRIWGANNQTIRAIANFIPTVDLAVVNYAAFLGPAESNRLTKKWGEAKTHCSGELPRSLSSGSTERIDKAKTDFLAHTKDLLSYAKI